MGFPQTAVTPTNTHSSNSGIITQEGTKKMVRVENQNICSKVLTSLYDRVDAPMRSQE